MPKFKSDPFNIGPVRLGYVDSPRTSLFKPFKKRASNGDEYETYGCTAFLPEDAYQQLKPVIDHIGRQAFPQEWDNQYANLKRGIHRGEEKSAHAAVAPYYVNLSNNYAPQVVDAQQQPVMNVINPNTGKKEIYDGVWAYVNVTVMDFNESGGKGISLKVNGVMKYADGDQLSLGGGQDAATMFANLPGAPAPGTPTPVQSQVPQAPAPAPTAAPAPQPPVQQPPAPQPPAAPSYIQAPAPQPPAAQSYSQAPTPQPAGGVHPMTGQPVPPVQY